MVRLFAIGDLEAAREALQAALALNASYPDAYCDLGECPTWQGCWVEIVFTHIRLPLTGSDRNTRVGYMTFYWFAGCTLCALGEADAARSAFENAISLDKDHITVCLPAMLELKEDSASKPANNKCVDSWA